MDGDSNELNDTKETATALPIDTDAYFSMGGYGDEDWFWFEVSFDEGEDQKLCTLNFFDLNSDYSDTFSYDLYAPDGTEAAGTSVKIQHSNVFACTQEGVYYLRVYCKSTSPSRSALRVRVDEGGADPYESNDTWLTATPVQTEQPIFFQLATTSDADWFKFEVPEADMTVVVTLESGNQTNYQLWDAGTLAEYGTSGSRYRCSGSVYTPDSDYAVFRYKLTQSGTYYLKLTSVSSDISTDLRTITIDLEEAVQLTATVTPADADNAAVTWSTTNVSVAKVDQNGTVTAAAPGVCVITASAGSYRASCVVTVLAARKRVESISFDTDELEIRMTATSILTVNFAPADATVKTLTWVSSDPRVASVSRTGVVTGLAVGETVITATTLDGGKSASITVKVTAEGVQGDINGDGYIDAADAMFCLRAAVGLVELTADQKAVADVNKDGLIDAGDAIKILRYDAGLIDSLN